MIKQLRAIPFLRPSKRSFSSFVSINKLSPHIFEVALDDASTQNELSKKMVNDLTRSLE